jgi:predicted lipoprotein with Yx(FWY)xxD motif
MKRSRTALISGAVALTSFIAVGAGAAASAAPSHASSVHRGPSTAGDKPSIDLESAVKAATVHTSTATVNGKTETILVNAKDQALYYFQGDTAKRSAVSGGLLMLWPALVSANPSANGTRGKLSSLKDASGRQVTYNGHLLYSFIDDTPGQVTGQGVSDFFVATPTLKSIGGAKKASAPAPTTTSSGGYGY